MQDFAEKSKGGPLNLQIFAFFQVRKSMKNPEISKSADFQFAHFARFPENFFRNRPIFGRSWSFKFCRITLPRTLPLYCVLVPGGVFAGDARCNRSEDEQLASLHS